MSVFTILHQTPKGEICIRQATVEDAEGINACTRRNIASSDQLLLTPTEFNQTTDQTAEWIHFHTERENCLLQVAVCNGQIVAVENITGQQTLKARHVANIGIAVLPEFRGLGVGKRMLQQAIDWAKDNVVLRMLRLELYAENKAAYHLYKSLQFEEEGRLRMAYINPDGTENDSILMAKSVD